MTLCAILRLRSAALKRFWFVFDGKRYTAVRFPTRTLTKYCLPRAIRRTRLAGLRTLRVVLRTVLRTRLDGRLVRRTLRIRLYDGLRERRTLRRVLLRRIISCHRIRPFYAANTHPPSGGR